MSLLDENKENCIKTPSKCIIWVGGKVCSISVCEGDTLEQVIKKMGKVLFSLEKTLDINSIDFSDLLAEKECGPKDLKDLIQLIINKVLEKSTVTITAEEITVTAASCFQDALTAEPISIKTYVEYLGTTLCGQKTEIQNLKDGLAQANISIKDLQDQVELLIGG